MVSALAQSTSFARRSFRRHCEALVISGPIGSSKTSIRSSIKTQRRGSGGTKSRGLLDTSVAVQLDEIAPEYLPVEMAISALTLAELLAGPRAAPTAFAAATRLTHANRIRREIESLEFDDNCAEAYGRVYGMAYMAGRKARGRRAVDLMIGATALANELPLFTRNATDLRGLDGLIEIVDLG